MNVSSHDLFSREGWIVYPSGKNIVESVEHRHPVSYKKCENRGTRDIVSYKKCENRGTFPYKT